MNASEISQAREVVERIAKALAGDESPDSLRLPAAQYAAFCQEANRLHAAASKSNSANSGARDELMQLVEVLNHPGLSGWRDFCLNHDLPVPEDVAAAPSIPEPGIVESASGITVATVSSPPSDDSDDPGFDEDSYNQQIEALISGESKKGLSGRLWMTMSGIAAVIIAGLVFVLLFNKNGAGALRAELNALLGEAKWEEARTLVDGYEHPEDLKDAELAEPLAALAAAERFHRLPRQIHQWAEPKAFFESAGRDENDRELVGWENRPELADLRTVAQNQLEGWLKFRKQLEASWGDLQKTATAFENSYADPSGLKEPSAEELSKLVGMFAVDGEDTPHAAAESAIQRLGEARAIVTEFAGLVEKAEKLKPGEDSQSLKDQVGELRLKDRAFDLVSAIEEQVEKNRTLEAAARTPLKELGITVSLFDPGKFGRNTDSPLVAEPERVTERTSKRFQGVNLPPTFLVQWREDHQYEIELNASFAECGFSEIVGPDIQSKLAPDDLPVRVPIVGDKIRENVAGKPSFTLERRGEKVLISGEEFGGAGNRFDGSFLIRFAADADAEDPEFQVAVCRAAAPAEYFLEMPVAGSLALVKDEKLAIELSNGLADFLSMITPGDRAAKWARLFLRAESEDGKELHSRPFQVYGELPFAKLMLEVKEDFINEDPGTWYIDLEIPSAPGTGSAGPPERLIGLIRFTEDVKEFGSNSRSVERADGRRWTDGWQRQTPDAERALFSNRSWTAEWKIMPAIYDFDRKRAESTIRGRIHGIF